MPSPTDRARALLGAILYEARAEQLPFLAGSIAYHAFVSMFPLLVLLLAAVTAIGDESLADGLLALTSAVLTPGGSQVLVAELREASNSAGVSAFGAIVLLWGTLRIFRGLDTAFSEVYESEAANTLGDQLADGLLVLATFAIAVVAAGYVESGVSVVGEGSVAWLLRRLVLVAGLVAVLFPMYYLFPDVDVSPVEVLPGVVVTAVGLTALESLFRVYVAFSGRDPRQSLVASVLVFLTWLYFLGLVVLLGAVVNAVLSNRSHDVDVDPVFGGVPRRREHPRRAEVVGALEALERAADTSPETDLVVDVGGERVVLPPPDRLRVDVDDSPGGDVGVELEWSIRE